MIIDPKEAARNILDCQHRTIGCIDFIRIMIIIYGLGLKEAKDLWDINIDQSIVEGEDT